MVIQILLGTSLLENKIFEETEAFVSYPGKTLEKKAELYVSDDTLARHLLLLGGSGCGKTNTFFYTLKALRTKMSEKDFVVIFDTKGEYYDLFSREGDYVLGNSMRFRPLSYTWNLFDEVLADGWEYENVDMNAREISAALFHGRGSSTQPFFSNAARDIFRGMLLHFIRRAQASPDEWLARLNNRDLIRAFSTLEIDGYKKIFSNYPDLKSLLTYFGDGKSNQALGVFGELQSMISDYFVGIMAQHRAERSLSMRRAVRAKGGRALFIEYDLSVGETLSPIYRLLIDQALKEALGRTGGGGRLYFLADEFKLLPKLQHIDDALNFGRGQGLHLIAGIQSIDQLYDIYGKERGAVIAGGFGSLFAFHTNDHSSREYITRRFGKNMSAYQYTDRQKNMPVSREREGNTVEEWEQMQLGVGQAVVGIGYEPPFLFQFDEYAAQ